MLSGSGLLLDAATAEESGGQWTNIEDATSATYTPSTKDPTDDNLFLRATASYTDPQASGKSMNVRYRPICVELDTQNKAPKFPDQDMETDGDQLDQTRKVDENVKSHLTSWETPVTATDDNPGDLVDLHAGRRRRGFFQDQRQDIRSDHGGYRDGAELRDEGHLHGRRLRRRTRTRPAPPSR